MHGRKKPDQPRSATEVSAIQQKADLLLKSFMMVIDRRKRKDYSEESLELVGRVLRTNPDFYTAWNLRREILVHNLGLPLKKSLLATEKLSKQDISLRELKLTEDCIKKNPKSYGAWDHRKWITERMDCDYGEELELCRTFLSLDQRNFHCWNYRRFIVQESGTQATDEFSYSTEKIEENFSNYSAFHHRSVFIKRLDTPARDLIDLEFSITENAIYTEPDDQSAWWYHQFLLSWLQQNHRNLCEDEDELLWLFGEVLPRQLETVRNLLGIEPNSKWAMNSLSSMLEIRISLGEKLGLHDNDELIAHAAERRQLLQRLCEIDINHINRYKYLLQRYNN